MALDELIRSELRSFEIPFDAVVEADAIRERVRLRRARRVRRRLVAVPLGMAAAVAIGVVAVGLRPDDSSSVHLSTITTTTLAPTTTAAPDPLAATGVCRSLLPTTVDPLDPAPAASAPTSRPQGTTSTTSYVQPPAEVDTPCGLALAADVEERIAPTWRPWVDNPFGDAPVSEMAPPDSYGTVNVNYTDDSGAILQVRVGYGVPGGDVRSIQGFGRPLDDLPAGWSGTTDFVPGEDRISADVTVVRPGRLPVMVAVQLGNPGMGPPKPEGSVLPMTYADVRALAIAIAVEGPAQSP